MRILATLSIQPHLSKQLKITPEKLLPFPWDKPTQRKSAPEITAEEQRERMRRLVEKLGDELV